MTRRLGARSQASIVAIVLACTGALGCIPARGGWDVDALLAERPDLAALPGQRLGDLTPYPALPTDSVRNGMAGRVPSLWLVACRYAPDTKLELRVDGAEWPSEWATAALVALDLRRFGLHAEIASPASSFEDGGARVGIERRRTVSLDVESIGAAAARGPVGLGDTLTLCDVSMRGGGAEEREVRTQARGSGEADARSRSGGSGEPVARPRGELVGGRVRLRRRLPQPTGRVHEATREEWVAAFLHEFAHALGFAGHAAVGDSPIHRDQSALRDLARRALRGEVVAAPNLSALYGLAPGQILGRIPLTPEGAVAIARVERAVTERSARVGPAEGPLASVGDEEARLAWRWPDGHAYDVRFPRYVESLRKGEPVHAEPGPGMLAVWRSLGGPLE